MTVAYVYEIWYVALAPARAMSTKETPARVAVAVGAADGAAVADGAALPLAAGETVAVPLQEASASMRSATGRGLTRG
jgi:hypothetical protein